MKTVVVTGASRGIGKAIAAALKKQGYRVIGTSTSGTPNDAVDEMVLLDQNDRASIQKSAKQIVEFCPDGIDLLCNNAGFAGKKEDLIDDIDTALKTMQINILGMMELTTLLLPHINKQGLIIATSSDCADPEVTKVFDLGAYNISKAAVDMYTLSLGLQLTERGKKAIAIDPEWVITDMGSDDAFKQPEEVAQEVLMILEDYDAIQTGCVYLKGKVKA